MKWPRVFFLITVLVTVFIIAIDSELQKGHRISSTGFYKGTPYGLNQCLNLCLRKHLCKSFNFNRQQLTCELFEVTASILTKQNGFTYGEKSDFMVNVPGQMMTTCYTTSNGNEACVKTECPHPSAPSDTYSFSGAYPRQVSGSITFVCYNNYLPIGDMTITCQPNGAWSEVGHCQYQACDIPSSSGIENVGGGGGVLNVGGTWSWFCYSGYTLVGQATVTCQADLTWTPFSFACI